MIKSLVMTEAVDTYTAGTSPEDFAEADLPDDLAGQDGSEGDEEDLGWGFTVDPKTGQRRAKKAPGRPKNMPGADELAKAPELAREPDRAPQRPAGRRPKPPGAEADEPKMPRGGVIAAGVNKLYRRGGKIIRGLENGDPMGIGQAFIECTKIDPDEPEDERELTVGEAWEALARSNPRIRAFILKALAGGDIGDLVMAHAPIGIALVMKPWVQRIIKPGQILESLAEPDEEEEEGTALPGGLTREDMQQMADLTSEQAKAMARKAAAGMGIRVSDADLERAARQAADKLPPRFTRQQPKKQSRAQRAGGGR